MDLSSLIAAYLIAQGAHTGGHFYQGANPDDPLADLPVSLDMAHFSEHIDVPDKWGAPRPGDPYAGLHISHKDYLDNQNRKSTDVHGAGFAMQDRVRNMITDPETKGNVSNINALMKALYMAGITDRLPGSHVAPGGDIGHMERASGNEHVRDMLAASMISDLWLGRHPENKWSLDFTTVGGAPGLKVSTSW